MFHHWWKGGTRNDVCVKHFTKSLYLKGSSDASFPQVDMIISLNGLNEKSITYFGYNFSMVVQKEVAGA